MDIDVNYEPLHAHQTDALIVGFFEGGNVGKELKAVDAELNGALTKLVKDKEFKAESGETKLLHTHHRLPTKHVLMVGLGKKKEFTSEKLRRASAKSAKLLRGEGLKKLSTTLHLTPLKGHKTDETTQVVVEGLILGLYKFDKYRTVEREKIKEVKSILLVGQDKKHSRAVTSGLNKARILADNTNTIRDLVNEPAEVVTPTYLAKFAQKIAKDSKGKIKVKILGLKEIKEKKMGGLLGVSKGSTEEPRFIVLEYKGGAGDPVVFVGKGITFDSGGLDIKPAKYMEDMRSDMAGAATVLCTVKASFELGLKRHVVAIVPTCENMPGPSATKQGDILTAYNGKTIEVWHTDAEGRLVLADGLSYAEKHFKAKAIIDIATLTGASIIALGYDISALMTTDGKLLNRFFAASKATDEPIWQLPLFDDYKSLVKGDRGDVRNMAKEGMGPGTITAGLFLENFVDKTPWAHLDIGAAGWSPSEKAYKAPGGTGVCLRTFIRMLEDWK